MLYIGLMSGTSLDGVDAVLVDFSAGSPKLLHTLFTPMPDGLRLALLNACSSSGIPYGDLAYIDVEFARLSAQTVSQLLSKSSAKKEQIRAIGSHGQTIFHHPYGDTPTSLQIGDPNIIAELTGITTVADFRRRDMAAKGQGAPLVPAFHQAAFSSPKENRIILNIGGIANITVLPKDNSKPVTGFDTGPGNVLMDYWCGEHFSSRFDKDGAWASSGKISTTLLEAFFKEDYLALQPPKSTGRELFNGHWLQSKLVEEINAADVQATLCEFTALTISKAIETWATQTDRVIVCGGGAYNKYLLSRLDSALKLPIETSAQNGIAPDWVEASAFAWLAKRTLDGLSGNIPTVTGAEHPVILGGIYQR